MKSLCKEHWNKDPICPAKIVEKEQCEECKYDEN